ncbi:MAG: phage baseplate assembly protein V [Chloroflexota bacterium]|jgi:phage baseplate assembly protein gpV
MTTLVTTIQEIIRDELRGVRHAELGVVEATYPHSSNGDRDNYGCDVRLKSSDLLLKRVPVSTDRIGTAAIPNVGDLVLLVFEQGDVNQPVIIGRLYTDTERPPVNRNDEIIFRLPLQEDDEKTVMAAIRNIQGREILVEMPSKITVQMVDDAVKVTAGNTEMTLEQPGGANGVATVHAGRSTITVKQDGNIVVEAAGDLTMRAAGDVAIEGNNVTIESQMNTDVKAGMQASIKGQMGATVDGGLSATLKGLTVTLKGLTSFSQG